MVPAVVILFFFFRGQAVERPLFSAVLRSVMSLGTLALAVAYAAAVSQNKFTTSFVTVLVALLLICAAIFTGACIFSSRGRLDFSGVGASSTRLLLSAIFVASMAYTAGLSPPGGFLLDAQEGHRAGGPALLVHHRSRFTGFYVGNTMAFVASLFIILPFLAGKVNTGCWLAFCNNIAQNGLVIAYAAGSNMEKAYIAYVIFGGIMIVPVMALMLVIQYCIRPHISRIWKSVQEWLQRYVQIYMYG